MRKIDNKAAQGSQMMMIMLMMFVMLFIFGDQGIRSMIAVSFHSALYPIIGFGGKYPLLTIFIAGIFVVFLSSFFTNLFTDWKAMGKAQETSRSFQKELQKARKEGNTNKVNKLMKMQPQIMKMTTESSSGMMKPMMFLMLFIAPIFIWLTYFLGTLEYTFFTVPWTSGVSLFGRGINIMSNWFLVYMVFSMVFGQLLRQGMKLVVWSDWWKNTRQKIIPSFK